MRQTYREEEKIEGKPPHISLTLSFTIRWLQRLTSDSHSSQWYRTLHSFTYIVSLFHSNSSTYETSYSYFTNVAVFLYQPEDIIMATMSPKRPIASAKIRIRIIPTKSLGWMAFMRTPTSPTTPIAKPEAYTINKILIKIGILSYQAWKTAAYTSC